MTKVEHDDLSAPQSYHVKTRKRLLPSPHKLIRNLVVVWFWYIIITLTVFLTEEVVL